MVKHRGTSIHGKLRITLSKTIGAFAPVTWTDPIGGQDIALFIFGDSEEELAHNASYIHGYLMDEPNLDDITVIEVTHAQWWDIKHHTNINKGFYVNREPEIKLIKDLDNDTPE